MRKLTAVGVLMAMMLLATAGVAMAGQTGGPQAPPNPVTNPGALPGQGGTGDPLQLNASGAVLPFVQGGANGLKALLEIASPSGPNCNSGLHPGMPTCTSGPDIHVIFYTNSCARQNSVPLPETDNDIAFLDPSNWTGPLVNGLAAVGGFFAPGNVLTLLQNPIHSRTYEFNPVNGVSRIFEPIIIDSAEFGLGNIPNGTIVGAAKMWSPLRTGATFFAPFVGIDPVSGLFINTNVTFICPRDTIQGSATAPFGQTQPGVAVTTQGFPQIDPKFWTQSSSVPSLALAGVIYDVDEGFLSDVTTGCDCLTLDVPINSIGANSQAYSTTTGGVGFGATKGTYTEIFVLQVSPWLNNPIPGNLAAGSFVLYKDVFSTASPLNKFFGRASNGSVGWIQGFKAWDSR